MRSTDKPASETEVDKSVARAILSSPSGYLVEYIGWSKFFIISTFLGLPSIIILFWMFKMFPLKDQKSMR